MVSLYHCTVCIGCIHGVSPCFDRRREFHFPADRWVVMRRAVAAVDTGTHDTTSQDTQYTNTLSSVLVTHTLAPYTISRDQDTRHEAEFS